MTGRTISTISGSCIERGQKDAPLHKVKQISASFIGCFLHKCVISLGTKKTFGMWGCANLSSLNNSTTVSMAAGGGIQSLASWMLWRSNQSSGLSNFRFLPHQGSPSLPFHQESTHCETRVPDSWLVSSFSKTKVNGCFPAIMSSSRSPRDRPSMSDSFMRVPAIWITCRMQPVSFSSF